MEGSLGSTIRSLRRQAQLTQAELAQRAGFSRSYVSRLEGDTIGSPSADYIQRLARALGVDPSLLARAAGYVAPARNSDDERSAVLRWIDEESAAWTAEELRVWARIMLSTRAAIRTWRTS